MIKQTVIIFSIELDVTVSHNRTKFCLCSNHSLMSSFVLKYYLCVKTVMTA